MNEISKKLGKHYESTFEKYGATSQGVDWGDKTENLGLRYDNMLRLLAHDDNIDKSLLDVGCGYGGLLGYAREKSIELRYTGIDIGRPMIEWANENYENAEFICADFLESDSTNKYDYVVCNGILTQKLDVPNKEMDVYANSLIKKMYSVAERGIVFNIMTTKVNYFSDNLYYRNPVEMLGWCLSEITPYVLIDHSYPLYEYTVYLYRNPR